MSAGAVFLPCGDTGLTVEFGDRIDRELSRRVVGLRAALETAAVPGIVETVPSYRSLLVHYDPLKTSHAALVEAIGPLLRTAPGADENAGRSWRLPVCFDGPDFAPDLAHVAAWSGMSAAAVIEALTAGPLYVYMLGFAPGQPYMGDLPDRMAIPRRQNPVARIPAGSVVTATGMAVIYPIANPTGWHVVGRTPAPLFDAGAASPALLAAGDRVTLERVSAADYADWQARLADGERTALLAGAP